MAGFQIPLRRQKGRFQIYSMVLIKIQLEKLCNKEWSKNTFHVRCPFMKRKAAEGETQLHDARDIGGIG